MSKAQHIWVRCGRPAQADIVKSWEDALRADGDPVRLIATFPPGPACPKGSEHPETDAQFKVFHASYRPIAVALLGETATRDTLQFCATHKMPCVIFDAAADAVAGLGARWRPGRRRELLETVRAVFAVNDNAASGIERSGISPDRISVTGPVERMAPLLPYHEAERASLTKAISTRPVWLAAGATTDEIVQVIAAQRKAAQRAHRLLLIVLPETAESAAAHVAALAPTGLRSGLRSQLGEPEDNTDVFIADLDGELGLWYRIAPITYFGGSLRDGARLDPFAAAALGSVVVHGRSYGAFKERFARLQSFSASCQVDRADLLGTEIAWLLSAEKAAKLAHAGWDVTSRGAEIFDRIVTTLRALLDGELH